MVKGQTISLNRVDTKRDSAHRVEFRDAEYTTERKEGTL